MSTYTQGDQTIITTTGPTTGSVTTIHVPNTYMPTNFGPLAAWPEQESEEHELERYAQEIKRKQLQLTHNRITIATWSIQALIIIVASSTEILTGYWPFAVINGIFMMGAWEFVWKNYKQYPLRFKNVK